MKKNLLVAVIVASFIGVGVASRLLDHPHNFVPLAAMAMTVGYYLQSKWGWVVAISALFVSDLFIGFYHLPVMLAVYGSYILSWVLGRLARSGGRGKLLPMSLFGSISFFLITNFAVWAFTSMYAKTVSGLMLSYTMAIPFFKWTLAGDLLFLGIFIAIMELAKFAAFSEGEAGAFTFNK